MKHRKPRILDRLIYGLGCATLVLLMAVALIVGYDRIDAKISHQKLNHGYVVEKYMDGDRYWYSSWVFGDIAVTRRHGGTPTYCITVQDGDEKDYWNIPEDEWATLSVGDYVGR